MARQVNTRFVVILGGGLCLGIAVVVTVFLYMRYVDRDPVRNKELAVEAEQKGNLKEALRLYEKAANRLAQTRSLGADALCTKVGDMAMAMSATSDVLDAEALYAKALGYWNLARQQNPRYLSAQEKLVEEYYKNAMFYRQPTAWTRLADEAKNLTEVDPGYTNGYTYLALAKLRLAESASGKQQFDPASLTEVEDLIKTAKEKDPTSKPVVLEAQLLDLKARIATQASMPKDAKTFNDAAVKVLVDCLAKYPNDSEAADCLARIYLRQRQLTEAVKLLAETLQANPGDSRLSDLLANIYQGLNQPDKAEEVLKKIVAANPTNPDVYLRLGSFYQQQQRTVEAIEAFKQVLAHPDQGGGIIVMQNRIREDTATFTISWLYMDAAERAKGGITSTEGADFIAQSEQYAGKLRANAQSDRNMLELLDGRMQLLKNNLDEALKYLKRANAWYDSRPPGSPEWRYTKSLMALAFNRKREWGLEQQYLDEYLKLFPRQPMFLIRKGRNLAQVAQYDAALTTVDSLLHPKNGEERYPPAIVLEAKKVAAIAQRGLGNIDAYKQIMDEVARESGTADAGIALANGFIAIGDLERAMDEVNKVLAQYPDNESAMFLGVMIRLRQGPEHKEEAAALLKTALEKYPKSAQFQFLNGRMKSSQTDPMKLQLDAAQFITDAYAKNIFLAQVYISNNDRISALDAFSKAAVALEQLGVDESRDKLASLNDQAFALALTAMSEGRRLSENADKAAAIAATPADKAAALNDKAKADELAKKGLEQAQLYVQKADRLNLDGVNGKIYQGRLLFIQAASRPQGLALLEQAVAQQPDNTIAHTVLGGAYVDVGRFDDALNEFQTAINQKPDNLFALISAIELLVRKGDMTSIERAKSYLRSAMQFSRNNPQLARYNDLIGNVGEAIRTREARRQRTPEDDDNTLRLASLYERRARDAGIQTAGGQADLTKAVELLRTLFDKKKDNLLVGNYLARLYQDLKKYENGKGIYETLLTNSDPLLHYDTLIAYGDYCVSLGLVQNALSLYREAALQEPAGREGGWTRIADLLFDLDDMVGAETVYRQCLEKKPDLRVQLRLARVFINLRKFDLAQTQIDEILKANPKNLDARILAAYSLVVQSKLSQGINAFNVILKDQPDNFDAMYYRALAQYVNRSDLKLAIDDLITIRSKSTELLRAGKGMLLINSRLLLARIQRISGKYAEAADEYQDIIKNLAFNAPATRIEYARFLLVLADAFYRLRPENTDAFAQNIRVVRPVERMIELLKDSQEKLPGQPIWFALQGQLLSLDPTQTAQAQKCFADAFQLSQAPEIATLYLNSLLVAKDYQKVIDIASVLIANPPKGASPSGEYYIKRGIAYGNAGKPGESLADFRQALSMASQDINLYMIVARQGLAVLKDAMAAELQARIAAKPEDYFAKVALAEYLKDKDQTAEAIKLLSPLLAQVKSPSDRDIVLRTLAASKSQAKDFMGASKDYRELLKISSDDIKGYQEARSDDIQALNNFAFMLATDLRRPEEALILAEKAVQILKSGAIDVAFANNGNIYDTYGWIKFLAGDMEGAIFQLKQAIQTEAFPVGYLHLGLALAKNGQKQEAIKMFDTGIKLAKERRDPTLKDLEAALAELKK
ncbi:MAG: tetratricopeptide repeat protein [Phycisphaerales bacterium]|nr:tetratricopeptide repeat protein [Phycisphaerales bacterium]